MQASIVRTEKSELDPTTHRAGSNYCRRWQPGDAAHCVVHFVEHSGQLCSPGFVVSAAAVLYVHDDHSALEESNGGRVCEGTYFNAIFVVL